MSPEISRQKSRIPVLLTTAGMEYCRLYAALSLLFLIPGSGGYPAIASGLVLIVAMGLATILGRLRIRRVSELLIHSAGILVFLFLTQTPEAPWAQVLQAATILLFWLRGRHIGMSEASYRITCGRFDVGLLLIFLVYFLRLGLQLEDLRAVPLVGSYLLFGTGALYFARNQNRDASFSYQSSATGTVVLFVLGFILSGGLVLLGYPLLTRAAGELFTLLHDKTAFLTPYLIAILRFLFRPGFSRPAAGSMDLGPSTEQSLAAPEEPGFWAQLVEKILLISLIGIVTLVVAGLVAYAMWRLMRYLLKFRQVDDDGLKFGELLHRFLARLRVFAQYTLQRLRRLTGRSERRERGECLRRSPGSVALRRLLRWGRISGVPKQKSETPLEYGARLAGRFPALNEDAATIVESAAAEIYGARELGRGEQLRLQHARRGLLRPGLIPARVLGRLRLRGGRRL